LSEPLSGGAESSQPGSERASSPEPALEVAGDSVAPTGPATSRWRNPVRVLYDWVLSWAERPEGPWALSVFAFAESSFFPIPPDVLLIPLSLSAPSRALWFATLSTVFSVLGGMFGYFLGAVAFDSIGRPLLELYGLMEAFARLQEWYQSYDVWAVGLAGFTPIPYKVFTVSAGFFKLNFAAFVFASTLGRGGRFFLVAILLRLYGEPIREFIDRYFNWLTLAVAVLFVGGFLVLHYGIR
jgi:membrane protein YqaA with SNARE-associated domain